MTAIVRDYMNPDVVCVRPEASFKEIVETLMHHDISGMPVVDDDGTLLGIVTEGDLLGRETQTPSIRRRRPLHAFWDVLRGRETDHHRKATGLTARDIMTTDPAVAGPDETLRTAARRMQRQGVRRLPVVSGARVVGILARQDVLHVFDRSDAEIAADVERTLEDGGFRTEAHSVKATVVDGVVRLTGHVHHEFDRPAAGYAVGAIDGVLSIENELGFRYASPVVFP